MELNVKDAARLLKLSEKTIYRMIKSGTIPCFKLGGQWRFSKKELLSWVEQGRKDTLKGSLESTFREKSEEDISISDILARGGVYYRVAGEDKGTVIRNSLRVIMKDASQEYIDRLFNAIMDREGQCSTAIGHGIALPHPRPLREFLVPISSISLCFLENPVPFDALDGQDVFALFFIFAKNEARYLKLQSKLVRLLREADLLERLNDLPLRPNLYEFLSHKESEVMGGLR